MNFKDTSDMMPSEMVAYISALESEIQGQQEEIIELKRADHYVIGGDAVFTSKETMIKSLGYCQVESAKTYRKLSEVYLVKINDNRVDSFADRIKAEGVAMLHDDS